MKNIFALNLIGLLIQLGLSDVSHLSKHGHNGYFQPHPGHNNLFIEQDYNEINSQEPGNEAGQLQHQSGYNKANRGYLPPNQGPAQNHNHHDHQHSQQEDRGYLPPPLQNQEHAHNSVHNHQLENSQGYLPPPPLKNEQHQIHNNIHNEQVDDRARGYLPPSEDISHNHNHGYLPPYQGQFEIHDEHHTHTQQHKQAGVEPNLQVSYYNNHAISPQHNVVNHVHGNDANPNEELGQGYNYSPPKQGFEEGHQHHQQVQQNVNVIAVPQSAVNVGPTSQNSIQGAVQPQHETQHVHHQSNEESHTQSTLKQDFDYAAPNHYQNEEPHKLETQGYLPPSPLIHDHTTPLINQPEQANFSPISSYQIHQESKESHQGNERGYLPPISALELPQSSDNLHITPPSKLGLHIQKSNSQPESNHVNVPLPIPQAGYYFVPGVETRPPIITQISTENSSGNNLPTIDVQHQKQQQIHHHQQQQLQQNHQQHQYHQQQQIQHHHHQEQIQQQQISTNEIPPLQYSGPLKAEIRIIPSIQTAEEIASQGYLTPSQVVDRHQYFADIEYPSPNSNHLKIVQQNFPPLIQHQNEVQNTHQQDVQLQSNFQNFAQSAILGVSNQQNQILRGLEPSNNNIHQNNAYLPPIEHHQQQQAFQNQEAYNGKQLQSQVQNQLTNVKTYSEHSNSLHGSLQYQSQQEIGSNTPPGPVSTPLLISKPTAIEAPAIANNIQFSSFTPTGYLPPAGTSKSQDVQQTYSSSIQLNAGAKQSVRDNTIFPIADNLGGQDYEISQIMQQLQGHIRTVQLANEPDNANKSPPEIKIFKDHNEVALQSKNGYLPPSNIATNLHRFRQSY